MLKTKTTISVKKISSISCWSDLTIYTEDGDEINVTLTLAEKESLAETLTRRVKEEKKRNLNNLREELEEADAEADD